MAHRISQAHVHQLVSLLGVLLPTASALACRPCVGKNVTQFSNSTYFEGYVIGKHNCPTAGLNPNPDPAVINTHCPFFIPWVPTILEDVKFKDSAYQNYVDQVSVISCLVYAVEMSSKGVQPVWTSISGIPAVCVNFTSFVNALKNHTVVAHPGKLGMLHHFSPASIKWFTVITCVLALLLALS